MTWPQCLTQCPQPSPFVEAVSQDRQRRFLKAERKAGLVSIVSTRALMHDAPIGNKTNPHATGCQLPRKAVTILLPDSDHSQPSTVDRSGDELN